MIFKLNDIISILNKYSVNIIYSKDKYHLSGKYEDFVFLKCGIIEDLNEAFNIQMTYDIRYKYNLEDPCNYYPITLENIEKQIQKLIKKHKDHQIKLKLNDIDSDFKK